LDFPDPFQARRLPVVSAKYDFVSCCCCPQAAKEIRVATEKTSDLKLQTWAAYSSYVGQVHVRVNTKKPENKYILKTYNEYFPFTRFSQPVYIPFNRGPKFFRSKVFLPMDYSR
jgi:hypothetical protein